MQTKTINNDTKEEEIIEDLYTEYEVQARISEVKAMQKEEVDYSMSKMKEEFEKQLRTQEETYRGAINTLQDENAFYKNIIKSILHI